MILKLTNEGKELILSSITNSNHFSFTKIVLGNGENTALTAVIQPKIELPISGITIENNYAKLTAALSNKDVSKGFKVTEIGVYASVIDDSDSEILYAVGYENADTADYVPAGTERTVEMQFDIMAFVGDAENVTIETNDSFVFATKSELDDHNKDTNAHGDVRDSLSLLQKCLSYKYSVTGGAVQRIDNVLPLEHTADITVHGTTDENGNGVKDPKVNIYGKNLFVFKTKSADGYVFSGSTVTVNAPTQHYGFNEKSTVNLPAGTYTISCNISGERTYNDGKPGFLVFYKIGDIEYGLGFSNFISGEKRVSKTFTLTEPAVLAFSHVWFSEIPPSADLTLKVQLEVGGTATEFEEYKEPQMFFAAHEFMQGQSWNLSTSNTVKAISPTMTVIVTDGNSLVNTVDVVRDWDLIQHIADHESNLIERIATLEAAVAALA